MTRLLAVVACVIAVLFLPAPVEAQVPYRINMPASAYGPCCYEHAPGAGYISYRGEYQRLKPWKVSIASNWLPRGTPICIEIDPQPDAHGEALRTLGAVKCDRPLVRDANGDPDHPKRAGLTISDHIPRADRKDLSRGFLDDIGFCYPGEPDLPTASERGCLFRWGVRDISLVVFG